MKIFFFFGVISSIYLCIHTQMFNCADFTQFILDLASLEGNFWTTTLVS